MQASTDWPDANATINVVNRETADAIEVRDSPREDCISIYYAKGDKRIGIRDINYTKRKHFREVLRAWANGSLPMRDCRTDKSRALPKRLCQP